MLIGNSKTEEKMKKIFIIAAAVLAFAGCAKEAAQEERVTNDGKEYMTFKVVAHDDVVLDDTKATLSRGGVFGWEDGEPIYFVAVGGTMATGSYNASAGTITVESGDWFCASTAPFDSDSKIKDFGLAKGPVVWAKVDGSTLHFYHIGSVINVKFDNIPIDGFLEFWPNGGKTWAGGNFHFYSSGDPELDDGGTDDIYIKKPITKADSGKDITLTVPNILYDYGFTVALSGTSARYFEKSTSNSFDLQALPTLLNMKQLSVPTYTVAGAISLRNRLRSTGSYDGSTNFEYMLQKKMENDLQKMIQFADTKNKQLQSTAESMRLSILGKDTKVKDDKPLGVVDAYVKENTTEVVDPLEAQKKADALKEKRDTLLTELDTQIKVSNATTFIEI